jgi:diketogulonate reductase-like aldo/keto reductase
MLSFYHVLSTLSAIPNVTLNNGVIMPMISAGTWQYDGPTAEQVVKLALSLGYNHIDAANDYNNQVSVGAGLKGVPRSSYFLTTKIDSQQQSKTAYDATMKDMELSLTQLDLDYVDLMLIHFPPTGNDQYCAAMQEQWRACEDFYKAGKARSIGVSNYCPSSFECILKTANITPAVNQVEIHVGMGPDPGGIISYCKGKGVQVQAYSPLGDGSSELISGDLVTGIGKAGIVARKISATLASTGTPSHFLHPTEAMHGDLGVLRGDDLLLALSQSGETEEITRLLPQVRARGIPIVAVPEARVEHHLGASYGRTGADKLRRLERNRVRAAFRSLPASLLVTMPAWTAARYALFAGLALAGRGPGGDVPPDARLAALRGVWDGFLDAPASLRHRAADRPSWTRGERDMLRALWAGRARWEDACR